MEKFIFGIKREKVIWHILKNQPKIEKDIDDKQCVVIQQVIKPAEIAAYTYCTLYSAHEYKFIKNIFLQD